MRRLITTMLVVLALFVVVAGRTIATEAQKATEPAKAADAACPAAMQGAGDAMLGVTRMMDMMGGHGGMMQPLGARRDK